MLAFWPLIKQVIIITKGTIDSARRLLLFDAFTVSCILLSSRVRRDTRTTIICTRCAGVNVGPFKTGLWLLLTAAMMVGLIYSLHAITSKFLSYPSSVGIVIESANDIQFPAVTVCNISPIRASRYNALVASRRRKRSAAEGNCVYVFAVSL